MATTVNKAVVLHVKVADVIVGERRRDEYGAVDELAHSIATYGLLHPIVVDEENNLVAGGRRLTAVQSLGWDQVPARLLGTLTPAERREIELEENLQRKDLTMTELEKSMDVVALAETAAEVIREQSGDEYCLESKQKSRGQPAKPDSIRKIAERIGVSPATITQARAHVAAVEAHPEVKDEPQATALDYAKAVRIEPELKGGSVTSVVEHYRANLAQQRATAAETPAQKERRFLTIAGDSEGKVARAKLVQAFATAVTQSYNITSLDAVKLAGVLDDEHLERASRMIGRLREWCDDMERAMPRGLSLVKGEEHG